MSGGVFSTGLLWVGLGGAAGAILRYLVVALASQLGHSFPLGTLIVNITGSLLIGLFAGFTLTHVDSAQDLKLFFQTGLLGAFTTFSAFSLDTLMLWQQGLWRLAVLSIVFNLVLCLAVVLAGFSASSAYFNK